MKKFRILLLTLFCLLLVSGLCGCDTYKKSILETPQGLSLSDTEILTWNAVKNAAAYAVNINGEEFITYEPSADLFPRLSEYKSYEIKVKAVGEDYFDMPDNGENYVPIQSEYSSSVFYEMEEPKFIYKYTSQTVHITNVNKISGKLVVPMELNSMPVTSIDLGGANCDGISGILITGYNKSQNNKTVYGTGLPSFTLSTLNTYIFTDMANVKRIYFPEKTEDAYELTHITLKNLNSLEKLTLPSNFYGEYSQPQSLTISGDVAFDEFVFPEGQYRAAISNCNIKKLTTPEIMQSLAAIINMPNLESLHWPKTNIRTIPTTTVDGIGTVPLCYGCPNLKSFTFDEYAYSNYYYQGGFLVNEKPEYRDEDGNILTNFSKSIVAYFGDSTDCYIPEGITSVGSPVFYSRFEHLGCLSIPNSVTQIGPDLFKGIKSIDKIYISGIKRYSYGQTEYPDTYRVTENNAIIKNDSILIYPGNSIEIPDGVKTIASGCFFDRDLTDLHIPSSVTRINKGAFSYCNVPQLYIPKNVTSTEKGICNNYINKSLTLSYCLHFKDQKPSFDSFFDTITLYLPYEHKNNEVYETCSIVFGCNLEYDGDYPYVYSFNYTGYDTRFFDTNQASIQLGKYNPKVYAPARKGYRFLGWSKTQDSSTAEYAAVTEENENPYVPASTYDLIEKGTLLYAVWIKI